jgi:hypothetical protein
VTDLLPARLDARFRPGTEYVLRFTGPADWLDTYSFDAFLGTDELTCTEDGDDLVVTLSEAISTDHATPEWSTFTLVEASAGVVVTGRWEPSLHGTLSPTTEVDVTLGAIAIDVTLALGPAGPGGGGGGVTNHGNLSGLDDNDHPQYVLKAGDSFEGDLTFDPTTGRIRMSTTGGVGTGDLRIVRTASGHLMILDYAGISAELADGGAALGPSGISVYQFAGNDYAEMVQGTIQLIRATAAQGQLLLALGRNVGAGTVDLWQWHADGVLYLGDTQDVNLYRGGANQLKTDDQFSAESLAVTSDDAYGAGWNGSLGIPTKNALFDKIELLQPLDSDLTAIAALTTTAYGRAFLALADASAGRTALGLGTAALSASGDFQPVDSDLTAIAALSTTTFGRGFLALADAAAGRTALGLGTAALVDTGTDPGDVPLVGDLRDVQDSTTVTPNTATPGEVSWDVRPQLPVEAVRLNGASFITSARLMTVASLPACTYANGTSGVGATLTGDANGALAAVDGVTPALGDVIVVNSQGITAGSQLQNGLYEVTQLGSAGTPFILTRCLEADEAADFLAGITVHVGPQGASMGGRVVIAAPATVVMGTTSIYWRDRSQPHLVRFVDDDFDGFTTTVTASGGIPGTRFGALLAGTAAQVSQVIVGVPTCGVAGLETGSTATGAALIAHAAFTGGGFVWDPAEPFDFLGRVAVPTVSTAATQEFWSAAGLLLGVSAPYRYQQTQGAYMEFPPDGSNIVAVTRTLQTAQTSQAWTRSSATITFTVTSHGLQVGDPVVISATSDAAALPNTGGAGTGYVVLTVPTANTFTVLGIAAGGASGTATVQRSTSTRTDTGIATNTNYRAFGLRYDPAAVSWKFYISATLVATHTTNLPGAVAVFPGAAIQKTVGSTSRFLNVDRIGFRHTEDRLGMMFLPA